MRSAFFIRCLIPSYEEENFSVLSSKVYTTRDQFKNVSHKVQTKAYEKCRTCEVVKNSNKKIQTETKKFPTQTINKTKY